MGTERSRERVIGGVLIGLVVAAVALAAQGCQLLDGLGLGDTLDGEDDAPDLSSQPSDTSPGTSPDTTVWTPDFTQPSGGDCGHDSTEAEVMRLANLERTSSGLAALECDAVLVAAARGHSEDMCERDYFEHVTPEGLTVGDRVRAAGGDYDIAGENIAWGYRTASAVHEGWMTSEGHRENILWPHYSRIGVGYVDCIGEMVWTQVFAD